MTFKTLRIRLGTASTSKLEHDRGVACAGHEVDHTADLARPTIDAVHSKETIAHGNSVGNWRAVRVERVRDTLHHMRRPASLG